MRYSQSLLRSAILLALVVAAGCDSDVDSVMAPTKMPSGPNALIVPTGYSDVSVGANFGCAVRAVDGGLVCWGDNDYGKATPPTVGSYRQVSAGSITRVPYVRTTMSCAGVRVIGARPRHRRSRSAR